MGAHRSSLTSCMHDRLTSWVGSSGCRVLELMLVHSASSEDTYPLFLGVLTSDCLVPRGLVVKIPRSICPDCAVTQYNVPRCDVAEISWRDINIVLWLS